MSPTKKPRNSRIARKVQPISTPPQEKPWPRPAIGIPLERTISYADKVFYNFLGIAQQGFPFIAINYGRTDLVRNKFALHLLQSDMTHLVMLDLDHAHPWDIVQRLMIPFVHNPDLRVVGGLNFRRGEPYDPCAFLRGDSGKYHPMAEWEQGLLKVDVIGTGSIAIDRRVFEQLEPPWFAFDYSKVMDDNWPGEDFYFSRRCTEAGIDLFVNTNITSPHLIDAVVDEGVYREYRREKGMGVIPVGDVIAAAREEEQYNDDELDPA